MPTTPSQTYSCLCRASPASLGPSLDRGQQGRGMSLSTGASPEAARQTSAGAQSTWFNTGAAVGLSAGQRTTTRTEADAKPCRMARAPRGHVNTYSVWNTGKCWAEPCWLIDPPSLRSGDPRTCRLRGLVTEIWCFHGRARAVDWILRIQLRGLGKPLHLRCRKAKFGLVAMI